MAHRNGLLEGLPKKRYPLCWSRKSTKDGRVPAIEHVYIRSVRDIVGVPPQYSNSPRAHALPFYQAVTHFQKLFTLIVVSPAILKSLSIAHHGM